MMIRNKRDSQSSVSFFQQLTLGLSKNNNKSELSLNPPTSSPTSAQPVLIPSQPSPLHDRAFAFLQMLNSSAFRPASDLSMPATLLSNPAVANPQTVPSSKICADLGVYPLYGLSHAQFLERLPLVPSTSYSPFRVMEGDETVKIHPPYWVSRLGKHCLKVNVLREGRFVIVPQEQVVLGDIIYVEKGGIVPADIRILLVESQGSIRKPKCAEKGWEIEEGRAKTVVDVSLLETDFVAQPELRIRKVASSVEDGELSKASNMAFASSLVIYGRLLGVVVSLGEKTLVGAKVKQITNSRFQLFRKEPSSSSRSPMDVLRRQNATQKNLESLFKKLCRIQLYVMNPLKVVAMYGLHIEARIVLPVRSENLKEVNVALRQLVGQGFYVLLLLHYGVSAREIVLPKSATLPHCKADPENMVFLNDEKKIEKVAARLGDEDIVFAGGPENILVKVVETLKRTTKYPVVCIGSHVDHATAFPVADLGLCTYESCDYVKASADGVLGPRGLETLVLPLRVIQEGD